MRLNPKNILKNLFFITVPALIAVFLMLEIIFRTIIPASKPPRGYFDEGEKIFHLSRKPETGLRTIGRFAEIRVRWKVNNKGWNYPVDYEYAQDREEGRRLIAVIGDSFIEALQVDVDRNYPYLLREMLMPGYDVYAFGRGGASFAHYLHVSRYIDRHFDPDIMIFNICYNDFDESIREVKPVQSYFMQLSINDKGIIREIEPEPDYSHYQYRPFIRFVFENSAVARYLFGNIRIKAVRRNLFARRDDFEGNIVIERVNAERDRIIKAVDYLIDKITDENAGRRVIFVMDAPREAIYSGNIEESKIIWLNDMMAEICNKYGAELIDLTNFMLHDYIANKRMFNSSIDYHYNEYGHEFIARLLYQYIKNEKNEINMH